MNPTNYYQMKFYIRDEVVTENMPFAGLLETVYQRYEDTALAWAGVEKLVLL